MSRRYYNDSDNEEDSFQKEYLNIFKNDFLEDDEADDDYNVLEDILTHKYNYDEKPFYLSIPKKEVNDVINAANLQDNLSIFSDQDNEYHFLARKTNRNKDIKENKNIIMNNRQLSNFSNNEHLSIIDNNSNHNLFNRQNLNISGISNINYKNDNINTENTIKNKRTKNNKLNGNNNTASKEKGKTKKHNIENKKNKNGKYNDNINKSYNNIITEPLNINNNYIVNNNFNNGFNNNFNNNNLIINPSNNYNDIRYNYFSKIKDLSQNKGLNQMDIIEKLLFLLKQYDFMLQLLIQNLMMTENKNLKLRCYTLLFSFYMAKQRVIENLRFPEFHVGFEFNEIFGERNGINNNINNKYQKLKLQLSFFQPPILEILPILVKFINKRSFTRDETIKILKDFFPFTNPLYFPISKKFRHSTYIPSNILTINNNDDANNNSKNNNLNVISNNNNEIKSPGKKKMRKKFNYVDDSLLLLGIYFHGKKNYEIIKQLWLPQRSNEEIRHRIKNLVCQNAPLNIIKKYKTMNENPLNQKDFLKFLKGIEWFGLKNKWKLISRYFLPEKTSDYLENFYELLLEKNVLPAELSNNNNKNNMIKYKNGNLKKVHIFMDDEIVKIYKEKFKDEINKIKSEITNMDSKSYFFSDIEYEKLDKEYFTRNKDDTRINTRNKSKKALNNNNSNESGNNNEKINEKIGGGNKDVEDKKNVNHEENKNNSGNKKNNKDTKDNNNISREEWEFQMNFLNNDMFEKITI